VTWYAERSISAFWKPASIPATAPPSSSTRAISAPRRLFGVVRHRLDRIRASERVDRRGQVSLVCEHLLRAHRQPRGLLAGQRHRLVIGIGVQ
jgi:hypothetical protein